MYLLPQLNSSMKWTQFNLNLYAEVSVVIFDWIMMLWIPAWLRLLENFSYFLYYLKAMKFPFSPLTTSITCNCGLHTISTAPSQVTGTCQRDWVNIILTACYLVSRSPSGETSNTDKFTYLHFNYSFSPAPPLNLKLECFLLLGWCF